MGSESELKWVSQLLQLSEDWLKQALTMKVTVSLTCQLLDFLALRPVYSEQNCVCIRHIFL